MRDLMRNIGPAEITLNAEREIHLFLESYRSQLEVASSPDRYRRRERIARRR